MIDARARDRLSVGSARASFVVCFVDVAVARSPTSVQSVVCEVRTHCFMNGALGEIAVSPVVVCSPDERTLAPPPQAFSRDASEQSTPFEWTMEAFGSMV